MNERQFEPRQPGLSVPISRHCVGTHKSEERRQAGTPATLEGNIDKAIDKNQSSVNDTRAQGHSTRWLISRYSVSVALAAIIATELGMGESR
jgi:hypothetical protein